MAADKLPTPQLKVPQGFKIDVFVSGVPNARSLRLGDSNDVFIVVEAGLKEGDEVVLNPVAFSEEAQIEALKTIDQSQTDEADASAVGEEIDSQGEP